ncbi:hypothetical protein [Spirillospora sp. NPDC047279]|uniref:hypothetical protein n=1 Tax=Spirillospora sp. NPDC047279 TaxID=3155478 RepID=UPI0033EA549A
MGEFIDVVLGFPTALFTFPLLVVAGYWGLVLLGGLGVGGLEPDADTGAGIGGDDAGLDGPGGLLGAAGLDGVPITIAVSLLVATGWFASLAGSVVAGRAGGPQAVMSSAVLVVAAGCAWAVTRLLAVPLRHVLRQGPETSLHDFVGRTCVIRTGRVGTDFGQAEVLAPDGSSALVQVRQTSGDVAVAGAAGATGLTAGSTALIFDLDPGGEFFWVMPYDAALDPERP